MDSATILRPSPIVGTLLPAAADGTVYLLSNFAVTEPDAVAVRPTRHFVSSLTLDSEWRKFTCGMPPPIKMAMARFVAALNERELALCAACDAAMRECASALHLSIDGALAPFNPWGKRVQWACDSHDFARRWRRLGESAPSTAKELSSARLATALSGKPHVEFSREDWDALGVDEKVGLDHVVLSDDGQWYQPYLSLDWSLSRAELANYHGARFGVGEFGVGVRDPSALWARAEGRLPCTKGLAQRVLSMDAARRYPRDALSFFLKVVGEHEERFDDEFLMRILFPS